MDTRVVKKGITPGHRVGCQPGGHFPKRGGQRVEQSLSRLATPTRGCHREPPSDFESKRSRPAHSLIPNSELETLRLRTLMRRMVEAIVAGRPIPRASIDAINALIGKSSGVTKVVKTPRKFERRFESELNQPRQLLVPLAESAADLLCRGDFSRLKRCDNSKCSAFFYDTSKNRMRRWCSGTECGNRMRVAKFYARSRSDD